MWKHAKFFLILVFIAFALTWLPPLEFARIGMRRLATISLRPFTTVRHKVVEYSNIFITLRTIVQENQVLRDRNTELEAKTISLQEMAQENSVLRAQLQLPQEGEIKLVVASISATNPSQLLQSLTIDKGSKQGIATGAPVTSKGFLVGVIDRVEDHSATIQLISSHRLRMAAKLQNSRTIGLLKGGLQGVVIEDIPIDVDVKIGEPIVTAGQQGGIRPGIPIGTVAEIISSQPDIYQTVLVKLPISFRSLDKVFIEIHE